MAKSKSGGTRSYIRGRVGADVYSIGKDGKGKKQQVVRSLAESVANPQTIAQMRGRMIMSTIMQAVSAMRPIIDHSFDNVAAGQPSLSEFIARNYALVKADIAANPASSNKFGLVKYQEKGIKKGAYIVAAGSAADVPVTYSDPSSAFQINLSADTLTIAGLKAKLGLTSEEYFTIVGISVTYKFNYCRFRVNPALADETAITASNIGSVFAIEGNDEPEFELTGNDIFIKMAVSDNYGIIASRKSASGFIHNNVTLTAPTSPQWTADVALPTYPVGQQRFLNGGDVNGESEIVNAAAEDGNSSTGGGSSSDGPNTGDGE